MIPGQYQELQHKADIMMERMMTTAAHKADMEQMMMAAAHKADMERMKHEMQLATALAAAHAAAAAATLAGAEAAAAQANGIAAAVSVRPFMTNQAKIIAANTLKLSVADAFAAHRIHHGSTRSRGN
jgi:hypothetical protein